MKFLNVLTLIFVALKLMGYIDWNWFIVILPSVVAIVISVLVFVGYCYLEYKDPGRRYRDR